MAVRLFMGNLPYDVTEAELRAHCAAVGPLVSLARPIDRDTGRPRGFAFVVFSERADAKDALLQQSGIEGQTAGDQRSPGSGRSCDHRSPSHRCASSTDLSGYGRLRPLTLRPRRSPAAPAHASEGLDLPMCGGGDMVTGATGTQNGKSVATKIAARQADSEAARPDAVSVECRPVSLLAHRHGTCAARR
jgi:RNA recognition motif-containing protein